jgi:hypothetical protein
MVSLDLVRPNTDYADLGQSSTPALRIPAFAGLFPGCFSDIPGAGPGLFIIVLQACFLDFLVDEHPDFIQTFVKVGSVTGELLTLVAEIDLFFLVTGSYSAVLKQLALLIAAALAVFRGQVIQHFFEFGIFFKNRDTQQGFKPFGVGLEIPQFFFELQAVPADISIHMGKTGLAAQAAGGHGRFDLFIIHNKVSFRCTTYGYNNCCILEIKVA